MRPAVLAACLSLVPSIALAGPASSLPWPSGGKTALDCLAALRGTPMDIAHDHVGTTTATWADQVTAAKNWVSTAIKNGPPLHLVSPWLLVSGAKGQFAQCAAGAFDAYWKPIGAAFATAAATKTTAKPNGTTVIVEPGWEANIGSGSHPWGVDDVSQVADYKACFQHVAAVIRSVFPTVGISWTNAHQYTKNYTVAQMDPGVEDAYGLMYYDNVYNKVAPKLPISATTWNNYLNTSNSNGPTGIGAWLAYAKAHGKSMGVSEWGLWSGLNGLTFAQADDPNYIQFMYQFFRANAASIGWDAYQNNHNSATVHHELCPNSPFPNAAAMYASIWH